MGGGRALSRQAARRATRAVKDPKIAARQAQAKQRLKKQGRKKFGRELTKEFLKNMNLNPEAIAKNKNSKTGGLLRSLGYNPNENNNFDFDRPALDSPQRVMGPSDPTISSLEKQLKGIAEAATSLGVISKKQQEQLLKQANDAERVSKESQVEPPDASPVAAEGMGGGLGGSEAGTELLEAIQLLKGKMDDAVREAQSGGLLNVGIEAFLDNMGLGGVKKARAVKRSTPQIREGFTQGKKGGFFKVDPKSPTGLVPAKPEAALKNFKTVDPSFLGKTAAGRQATEVLGKKPGLISTAISGTKNMIGSGLSATRGAIGSGFSAAMGATGLRGAVGLRGAIGSGVAAAKGAIGKGIASLGIAGGIGKVVGTTKGKVAAGTKIGKEAIAKVAGPMVSKALLKTGIKSIPIVGAAVGGLFAIGRLLKGDVVGAGLDATSGLAGPLTAVPALALSLSRDVYTSVFGTFPETDPQVGPRMAMVKDGVETLIKQQLGVKAKKPNQSQSVSSTGSTQQTTAPVVPPPPKSDSASATAPAAAPVSAPTPAASSSPATTSAAAPASAPAAGSSGAAGGGAESPQKAADMEVKESSMGEEGAPPLQTGSGIGKSLSGEKILEASTSAAQTQMAQSTGMTGTSPPMPSPFPTTKGQATGMGNVPEPTYMNLGSIAKQLYFGSVAGAMAA